VARFLFSQVLVFRFTLRYTVKSYALRYNAAIPRRHSDILGRHS
jgi:hypothetical protein